MKTKIFVQTISAILILIFSLIISVSAQSDQGRIAGSVGLLFDRGSKNKTGQHYGVGLQYDLNPALALRGEVETYRKLGDDSTGGELKVDVLSLGAIFRF